MTLRSAEPTRTCVGCRRRGPASTMFRCAAVDGRVRVGRALPGRGAWLCPAEACVGAAMRSGSLARALHLRREVLDDETRARLLDDGVGAPARGSGPPAVV